MPSIVGYHHVTDHDHWLSLDLREKKFEELGITNIRTFTDPTNSARVGVPVGGHQARNTDRPARGNSARLSGQRPQRQA